MGNVAGFQEWLDASRNANKHIDLAEITYSELHNYITEHPDCPLKELFVTATDVTADKCVVLSHENTPNIPIWVGVRMSMSFPSAFEAVKYDLGEGEHLYVDGGLAENYPINMFNRIQFVPAGFEGFYRRFGRNLGTLGIKIDSVHECARLFWNIKSYSDVEDLTVRVAEHKVRIRVVDKKPKLNEYHRNELCIYDISPVAESSANENNNASKEPAYKLKYVVKHIVKDRNGKEKMEEIEGEILQGEEQDQLSPAHMSYLFRNKEKFPALFDIKYENLNQVGRNTITQLLNITTERRHTPQKKLGDVESAGNKMERFAIGTMYSKTLKSHQKQTEEEERINRFYGHQTIQIYDMNVDTLQFDLGFREKKAMFSSGEKATLSFLENYMGEILPEDAMTDSIMERAKNKTVEELVELIEKYDEYIMGASEVESDRYPVEIYQKEKQYLLELVCYKLFTELNAATTGPKNLLEQTSVFSIRPGQFTDNRLKILESLDYILTYQLNIEKQKLAVLEQDYLTLINTNKDVLASYASIPEKNDILLVTSPSLLIYRNEDFKDQNPFLYTKMIELYKQKLALQTKVDSILNVEVMVAKRVKTVHAYKESLVRSVGIFRMPSTFNPAPATNSPSHSETESKNRKV